jgi:hypothetical protein
MNGNNQKNKIKHIVLALISVALFFLTFAIENSYYVVTPSDKRNLINHKASQIIF